MPIAINITHLSVASGKTPILHDISARIARGKITGLLGPSGAGKTTLIRALLGLQKPSDGQIKVLGMPAGSRKLRSQIGYVTQAPSVYADLTVQENIRYFAALAGVKQSQASHVIQEVELDEFRNQLVANLSGGQRARVSLAAALLGRPQLLLLDEPTVGLDPVLRQKLWTKFVELSELGTTIVVTSHVMDEADKCDELLFLRDGTLLAAGSRQYILEQTATHTMEDAFLKLALGADA